jgi:hypothetical protein
MHFIHAPGTEQTEVLAVAALNGAVRGASSKLHERFFERRGAERQLDLRTQQPEF